MVLEHAKELGSFDAEPKARGTTDWSSWFALPVGKCPLRTQGSARLAAKRACGAGARAVRLWLRRVSPRREGVYVHSSASAAHLVHIGIVPSHLRCFRLQALQATEDGRSL